jgi:splicing factor U2AF subunit
LTFIWCHIQDSRDRDSRRSRDRSSGRSHKRSHRDRSGSRDGRRRSSDRSQRHDRDRDKERTRDSAKDKEATVEGAIDKEKKDDKKDDKDRDREKDRDGRSSRSDRDRERERERDRDRGGRDSRRSPRRDREDRDRDRRSRRSASRSRSPGHRRGRDGRRRSRSASPDARRNRRRGGSRSPSPDRKKSTKAAEEGNSKPKPVTLRDIIAANPGISVAEAAIRLNAYNTAVARGLTPDPIDAPIQGAAAATGGAVAALAMSNPLLGGLPGLPGAPMGFAGEGGAATKAQRELYVGNLPPGITVPQLAEFLNTAFKQLGISKDPTQNTVITAWVSPESHYAFVELRTVEEATAALTYLNGIQVGMCSLKFGRPKGYTGATSSVAVPMMGMNAPSAMGFNNPLLTPSLLGTATGLGAANPLLAGLNGTIGVGEGMSNVIMVTNLPALITEQQVRELFTPFGELRAFNVIKTTSGAAQSAVFEYVNHALTDGVVAGMNNLDIAGQKLSVQRIPASSASVLLQPTNPSAPPSATPAPTSAQPAAVSPGPEASSDDLVHCPPSSVVRLSNMTTPQDLADDQSYEELLEDVADECNSHGTVKSIVIPRSGSDSSVGKIFVHFTDIAGAQATRKAVAGRRFNGRAVEVYFYPEELFVQKVLLGVL